MQSDSLGDSTQPSSQQPGSVPATGAAGQPKALPSSPAAGTPIKPARILSGPRQPLPREVLEAASQPDRACVIARCSTYKAWFAILLERTGEDRWIGVQVAPISDAEAPLVTGKPGIVPAAIVGPSATRITGKLFFSVPCPYCTATQYGVCSCGTLNCYGRVRDHEGHTDMYCASCDAWKCMTGTTREFDGFLGVGPRVTGVECARQLGPAERPALPSADQPALPPPGGELVRRG